MQFYINFTTKSIKINCSFLYFVFVLKFKNIITSSILNMKKNLLIGLFLVLFLIPVLALGQAPFVRCGNGDPIIVNGKCTNCCTICNFFETLIYIYNFLVLSIATPLAIVGVTIGGVFILISAGNPTLMGKGKQILWSAIIGLFLVFASWVIINTILSVIGYQMGTWWNPQMNCN